MVGVAAPGVLVGTALEDVPGSLEDGEVCSGDMYLDVELSKSASCAGSVTHPDSACC